MNGLVQYCVNNDEYSTCCLHCYVCNAGLGYIPACSSSSMSKTFAGSRLRDYCALFSS